ncbi:MAG: hypothetical protein FJ096_14310 [Deltaproteobacteria bacterium]|nr:hypothetical protein [Deltaproteobacteria bacterium]
MNGKSIIRLGFGLGALALACVACKGKTEATGSGTAAPSATAAAAEEGALAVGTEVVAATGQNSFTQGKVTAIDGSKITYEYGEPDAKTSKRPTYSVDKAKVFLLGAPPKAAPKVGDFVIAKSATGQWSGCEVKTAEGDVLGCEDWFGKANNVDAKTTIVPDAVTSADIRQSLARSAKHRAFETAAKAAGKPATPKGWKPKAKDVVVALFAGSSWHGATVEKVDGEKISIKWDSPAWKEPVEKALSELVPAPKNPAAAKEGGYVMLPPKSLGFSWEFRKVVSVKKDTAEVLDKDDQKSTVNLKDVLAVVP